MNVNLGFCATLIHTQDYIGRSTGHRVHSVDLLGKSGAIDFLFTVVGKTKGILVIDRKLVFPIQTTDDWLPGCHNCLIAIQLLTGNCSYIPDST